MFGNVLIIVLWHQIVTLYVSLSNFLIPSSQPFSFLHQASCTALSNW